MSTIFNFYIDVANLPKEKFEKRKNGKVFYNFTGIINDEPSKYNENVVIFQRQSKEQYEAKVDRIYHGNGSVIWTDGKISAIQKKEKNKYEDLEKNDLPF